MKHLEDSATTLQRVLRGMTFRQLLMLFLLICILLPTYLAFAVTRGIGPQFLLDIFQPVRFVGFVDDCPELSMSLNGQQVQVLYQTYRQHTKTGQASYVIAAYTREGDWTTDIKYKICAKIDEDVSKLLTKK